MIYVTSRVYSFLLLTIILVTASSVLAAVQTITTTVSQPYGGIFSAEDARVMATVQARRQTLEKAGTYIESLGIVKSSISKGDLPVLAAGVLETGIAAQKNYVTQDGFVFEVTARADMNTKTLAGTAADFLKDDALFKKYQDLREREAG